MGVGSGCEHDPSTNSQEVAAIALTMHQRRFMRYRMVHQRTVGERALANLPQQRVTTASVLPAGQSNQFRLHRP